MRFPFLFPAMFCCALLIFESGCRTEVSLVDQTSFTQEMKDPAGKLLAGLDVLTLEKAREIALKNNPGFQASFQAVNAARLRYYQAIGAYAPVISAGFSVGDQLAQNSFFSDSGGNNSSFYTYTTVLASWTLFDGLIREFQYLSTKRGLKMQEYMEENAKRLLIRAVAFSYHDIQRAKSQIRIAEADFVFQTKMFHEAESKQKAGTAPRSETLNFRGKANLARENKINAEYQYELGLYSLSVLMGYPEGTVPQSVRFPDVGEEFEKENRSLETFLDIALSNRPDLRAYRERMKIAQYQVYKTYGSFFPVVSAFANWGYSSSSTQISGNNPGGFGNFSQNGNTFNYGLTAGWLLFNGGIRYNLMRESKVNLEIAKLAGEGIWLNVVHEVRSAYSNYLHCVKIVEICKENVAIMIEQRNMVEREYVAGEVELTRLNEAQVNLIRSQSAYSDSLIQVHKALEQLSASAGVNTGGA